MVCESFPDGEEFEIHIGSAEQTKINNSIRDLSPDPSPLTLRFSAIPRKTSGKT